MTQNVSSYYELAPNRGASSFLYRGPAVDTRASSKVDFVTASVAAPVANDTVLVLPALPAGCKLGVFKAAANPALDSASGLTASVGWTSNPTAIMAAAAAFRAAGTPYVMSDTQLLAQTASAAGDNLIITFPAVGTSVAGVLTIYFEIVYP